MRHGDSKYERKRDQEKKRIEKRDKKKVIAIVASSEAAEPKKHPMRKQAHRP
jgi:hypothetical protein